MCKTIESPDEFTSTKISTIVYLIFKRAHIFVHSMERSVLNSDATMLNTHNITHTNACAMNASLSLIIFLLLTPCSHRSIFTSLSFCPDYTTRSYTHYTQTRKHILTRSNVGRQLEFLLHLI